MITVITTKRLRELERKAAQHDRAVIECNNGFGRWIAHNPIASAITARMLDVLLRDGPFESDDAFRNRLGLNPNVRRS